MDRPRLTDLHRLEVYRCALQLYRRIGRMVAAFPRGEADLRSQMRRASRSAPFNISEGFGKRGRARAAAYVQALGETKEQIVAAQDLADRGPWTVGRGPWTVTVAVTVTEVGRMPSTPVLGVLAVQSVTLC
jgi:four helix bundle protein